MKKSTCALLFTGFALVLIGLVLVGGGLWLIGLGGSWYYLIAGLTLIAVALHLVQGKPSALVLYAGLLAGSLIWALWESGLDWWPLAARLGVLFVLGLWLMTPWIARRLRMDRADVGLMTEPADILRALPERRSHFGKRVLGLVLSIFVLVAVGSWLYDPHEIADRFPQISRLPSTGPAVRPTSGDPVPDGEWHAYGRNAYGQRYSPLAQITPDNVANLELAWQFRTGDLRGRPGDPQETTFEVTPLKIGNRLFLCTPHQSVIALDATTGAEIWRYTPQILSPLALQHQTCRGLSYQPEGATPPPSAPASSHPPAKASGGLASHGSAAVPSAMTGAASTPSVAVDAQPAVAPPMPMERPLLPVASATTHVADRCRAKLFMPTTDGRLIALNPDNGAVCKRFGNGTGQIDLWAGMPNRKPGAYYSTSPVAVTKKLVIVGGTVLDNVSPKEQSGVIRAFDIDTGALIWNWDPAKPDDTAPLAPGQVYTANSPNSWSIPSVDEALDMVYLPMGNQPPDQWGGARSPAVEKYSSSVVALDIPTGKVRWVFQTVHHDLWDYDVPAQPSLLDLNIDGRSIPALIQPTKQGELFVLDRRTGTPLLPVSEVPAPQGAAQGDHSAPSQPRSTLSFDPPPLAGRDMWGATIFDQLWCRIRFHQLQYGGRFTPPSIQGSLIYPGNFGVFNWGGVAVDPQRQLIFATPTHLAFVSQLVPRTDDTSLLVQGSRRPDESLPALNENFGAPYAVKLHAFTSPLGIPCQEPPWGYVAGADPLSGKIAWMHRNGTVRDLMAVPIPFKMGVPNLGGPIATAGGVAFLSGTLDNYVRAYDVLNGKPLWQSRLPAGGQATPMSYLGADGRQYLLVVAGGHGSLGTKAGDYVLAYALPRR